MEEEAKRGQLAGALVRSVNMTTTLVWPQGWGKAEVATGVPMCSVFEQAAGNGTRACRAARQATKTTRAADGDGDGDGDGDDAMRAATVQ